MVSALVLTHNTPWVRGWGGSRGGSGGLVEPPKPVDYDAVVQKFAEQQPRRMLLADPIFEES